MGNKSRRFDYVAYDGLSKAKQESLKKLFEELEELVDDSLAEGRAKALVMTHLEIAYMWTGKALRDEQIQRNPSEPHVAERTNE